MSTRQRIERADELVHLVNVLPGDEFADQPACADPEQVDPEVFFPVSEEDERVGQAKAICAGCPVVESCLQFALRTGVEGVWGGTTDQERRQVRLLGWQDRGSGQSGEVAA